MPASNKTKPHTLYVSDLDGTLVNGNGVLSEFSRTTLQRLISEGLVFTVASARSVVALSVILKGVPLQLPVIEFNGAFLSDLRTGHHEVINMIDPSIAEDIYGLLPHYGFVPFISTFDGSEDCVYYNDIINEGMRWYLNDRLTNKDRRWRKADNLADSLRDQVVCFTIIGTAEPLFELEAAARERYGNQVVTHHIENLYSPGWYWLTIHDWHATKDQAIRRLIKTYDLDGTELVVFGDQANDLEMFHLADRAIAVANADPELKRHATEVIGSNEDDSVVKYLVEHVKGALSQ